MSTFMIDDFPEDIIFTRLKLPFSFRRRAWGMRPKPDRPMPAFCNLFLASYSCLLIDLV
jgi:hypothetical protein